jgi:glyoxylase-like metal-dependent hydrolase (beta-lactamase superfamily II)
MDRRTPSLLRRAQLTCHCVLVETAHELVLIDTGFGLRDVADPRSRLSPFFLQLNAPDFREEMTAIRQIERLGFHPQDVRHIVLTHLDFDHAGGLDDFPWAAVHLFARERDEALAQRTWLDRQRFRPQQWSSRGRWQVYSIERGEKWFGFERARDLVGLPPDILLVPLLGHTLGHCGVAVGRDGGWFLLAGDAYFFHGEMDHDHPWCTPGLALYQTAMEKDRRARLANQARLRELLRTHGQNVAVACSHDVTEFSRLAGHSWDEPVSRLDSEVLA